MSKTEEEIVDINFDDFLPIVPEEEQDEATKKSNMFKTSEKVDFSFLDEEEAEDKTKDIEDKPDGDDKKKSEDLNKILDPEGEKEDIVSQSEAIRKVFDDGVLLPFDDEKDISEYTPDEWKELIQANIDQKLKDERDSLKNQFFESLPDELKYVADYVANGGQDLKSVFKALSSTVSVKDLDPEKDSKTIIASYLQSTDYGSADEIDEQIQEWEELGVLEKKASGFKPKLEKLNEKAVEQQVKAQEKRAEQQREIARTFTDNVYTTLEKGEINGVNLTVDQQNMLFKDMTDASYDSLSGRKTNLLGHLLEKYQFGDKPNLGLVAEALWLLKDPDGYKTQLKSIGATDETKKTIKTLKTEQSRKSSSHEGNDKEETTKKQKRIPRPTGNIFKR